ncbi:beta-propeller fold lactonase family protein [Halorubrum amylolyticum]|uniref:hypothetical protein n=1 Tax=Halorubrum amylolyticum TaxID=2508724 RepID=UPI001008BEEA|nr:hypothetical protein [Halorubrum amylolyticum]
MSRTDTDPTADESAAPRGPLAFVKRLRAPGFAVVDATTHEPVGRVGSGRQPHGLVRSPGGRYGYVPYMGSNELEVVDLRRLTVANRVETVGTAPVGAAATRGGRHLFVSTYGPLPSGDDPGVIVLRTDGEELAVAAERPVGKAAGIAADARDDVWVVAADADEVVRIDGSPPFEVRDRFSVAAGPRDLTYSPAYGLVGVNCVDGDRVTVVDALDGRVLGSVPAPNPRGGTVVPASDRWIVGDTEGDGVTAIDAAALRDGETGPAAVDRVSLGTPTAFTDATPDGRLVAVDAYADDRVAFLDPDALSVVDRVPVGETPRHPRFGADGRVCYVPSVDGDRVTVVETAAVGTDGDPVVATVPFEEGVAPAGCFRTDRGEQR